MVFYYSKNSENNSQKYETNRSIILPNDLLISCIVFKWQPFENLKWRVNLIDRIYRGDFTFKFDNMADLLFASCNLQTCKLQI